MGAYEHENVIKAIYICILSILMQYSQIAWLLDDTMLSASWSLCNPFKTMSALYLKIITEQ